MRYAKWLAIASAIAAGVALRVWVYRSSAVPEDSDEAIVGLMARHLLHGEVTTFYWGQPYGGTQEIILVAGVFGLFGTSLVALSVVPAALVAITCVIVWRIGVRLFDATAAMAAACVLWLWPPYAIAHTAREFGFYASDLLYCALLLLLALRIVERPSRLRVGIFGLVVGLAFWETAQIIPIAVPVIAWTAWKAPGALRHAWAGVGAAVLGALPWLIWNIEHSWASLLRRSDLHSYEHGLRLLFSPLLPMLLGLRAPLTAQPILPKVLMLLVYVLLLLAFVYAAWHARHSERSLLYVVGAAFVLIWPISHRVTLLTSHPVYLIVISPVLALLVAQRATGLGRAVPLFALAALVSVVSLHRMDVWYRTDTDHWPATLPRSFAPLSATLERLGVHRIYADYWIAYRLSFDTRERVISTEYTYTGLKAKDGRLVPSPEPRTRYSPWQREVEHSDHGFVVFRQDPMPRRLLASHGYERHVVGPFAVYARR
jgi:4-amino-4-deoxy-L-arabinose transferase-like glycosyltransferase